MTKKQKRAALAAALECIERLGLSAEKVYTYALAKDAVVAAKEESKEMGERVTAHDVVDGDLDADLDDPALAEIIADGTHDMLELMGVKR